MLQLAKLRIILQSTRNLRQFLLKYDNNEMKTDNNVILL